MNELNEFSKSTISDMDELIGCKFKRNVYGVSKWTDVIKYVSIVRECSFKVPGWKPVIMVRGNLHSYPIDEILIFD